MEQRSFILSLFNMAPEPAYFALKQKIDASNDEDVAKLKDTLSEMIAEAQAGSASPSLTVSPQKYFQGLHEMVYYADQFLLERRVLQLFEAATQKSDSQAEQQQALELYPQITDPAAHSRVAAKVREFGKKMGMKMVPEIGECYRPGTAKYELKWPLSAEQQGMLSSMEMQFDQLAHLNQFAILHNEWRSRWHEGNTTLYAGDLANAHKILEECVARAEQLEVNELKALSYESLMAVAQKLGDAAAERKWLKAALAAREKG